jgi:hypothetical protein
MYRRISRKKSKKKEGDFMPSETPTAPILDPFTLKMTVQDEILNEIKKQLSLFDSFDLICKLAALRLLPQNGNRILRLDLLQHSASSIELHTGPKIKRKRLKEIGNSSFIEACIAGSEDPPSQCLCEEITFWGGGYRIFPGIYPSIVFNLKHLLKCLFLSSRPFLSEKLRHEFLSSALFILNISEEIARRAKINRYSDSLYGANLYVPPEKELEELAKVVLFLEAELEEVAVKCKTTIRNLNWLFSKIGEVNARSYDFENGQLLERPILLVDRSCNTIAIISI